VPHRCGEHDFHVKLKGEDGVWREIAGSPVHCRVRPGPPYAPRCTIECVTHGSAFPQGTAVGQPCAIRVITRDRYSNPLDRGGVRLDVRAIARNGGGAVAHVNDERNGQYTIILYAMTPGEVVVTVRIDMMELPRFPVSFVAADDGHDVSQDDDDDAYSSDGSYDGDYDLVEYDGDLARANRRLMCPTCNAPACPECPYVEAVASDFCTGVCQACPEGEQVVVLPCGHRSMCRECWEQHAAAVAADQVP